MYVLAFFNHSRYVELAFTELELKGARPAEISVLVNCQPDQSEMVEGVLWQHFALAVGEFEKNS